MAADNLTLAGIIIAIVLSVISLVIAVRNSNQSEARIRKLAFHLMLIRDNEHARDLCKKIKAINPHLCAGLDFLMEETEDGVKLKEWKSDYPKPE